MSLVKAIAYVSAGIVSVVLLACIVGWMIPIQNPHLNVQESLPSADTINATLPTPPAPAEDVVLDEPDPSAAKLMAEAVNAAEDITLADASAKKGKPFDLDAWLKDSLDKMPLESFDENALAGSMADMGMNAVPEPSSLVLLALGGLAIGRRRPRRVTLAR